MLHELSGKPGEMQGGGGVAQQWTAILILGGVVILLITSCYGNWYKLHLDRPLGLSTDLVLGHIL